MVDSLQDESSKLLVVVVVVVVVDRVHAVSYIRRDRVVEE
jgi:hypothetical protein